DAAKSRAWPYAPDVAMVYVPHRRRLDGDRWGGPPALGWVLPRHRAPGAGERRAVRFTRQAHPRPARAERAAGRALLDGADREVGGGAGARGHLLRAGAGLRAG